MVHFIINSGFEFFEVLNEFPCLKATLNKLHINSEKINEGESIHDFFQRKDLSLDEENLILRKLNRDVNYFLKKGELPKQKQIQMNYSLEEE